MDKCDCYHEREECIYNCLPTFRRYGVCSGIPVCSPCDCDGDESKCDFYPEKRKGTKKVMNTAEMWLQAQKDGKFYECINGDIAYSKELGLVDKYSYDIWELESWDSDGSKALDSLLGESEWEEMETMTRSEAENRLGIKIID